RVRSWAEAWRGTDRPIAPLRGSACRSPNALRSRDPARDPAACRAHAAKAGLRTRQKRAPASEREVSQAAALLPARWIQLCHIHIRGKLLVARDHDAGVRSQVVVIMSRHRLVSLACAGIHNYLDAVLHIRKILVVAILRGLPAPVGIALDLGDC